MPDATLRLVAATLGQPLFTNRNNPRLDDAIVQASGLIAQPAINSKNGRYGTFELWHRSARDYPLPANVNKIGLNRDSQMLSFQSIAIGRDARFALIPENGISLIEALNSVPGMASLITRFGGVPNIVRVYASLSYDELTKMSTFELIVHPGFKPKIDKFFENCKFNANDMHIVDFTQLESGGILRMNYSEADDVKFSVPSSTCDKFPFISFSSNGEEQLNEFGYLYLSLYIVGNYARYYPDFWIYDVEKSTQLGLLVEHLMNVAEQRIGLLALSELSQTFYVPV